MRLMNIQIVRGAQQGRLQDISKLKANTAKYLSNPGAEVNISDSKSGCGFNDNLLGRMLILVQHIASYDKDPVG